MRATHCAGFIEMRVGPFQALASSSQQGQPACLMNSSTIRVHRVARGCLLLPAAAAPIRFRNLRPEIEGRQIHQHLIAVIPPVRHDVVGHRRPPVRCRRDGFELPDRDRRRLRDGGRIALISNPARSRHNRAGLHVDGVLGFVGQMRAPVFHLRDARVGVVRVPPVFIATTNSASIISRGAVTTGGNITPCSPPWPTPSCNGNAPIEVQAHRSRSRWSAASSGKHSPRCCLRRDGNISNG
jgi:hypothetical protein